MCFDTDAGLLCSHVEESHEVLVERRRCEECRRWFNAGERMLRVAASENDPDDDDGQGEQFEIWMCDHCEKIRMAIRSAENAEPLWGELAEALAIVADYGDDSYADAALRMYPETATTLDYLVAWETRLPKGDNHEVECYGGES